VPLHFLSRQHHFNLFICNNNNNNNKYKTCDYHAYDDRGDDRNDVMTMAIGVAVVTRQSAWDVGCKQTMETGHVAERSSPHELLCTSKHSAYDTHTQHVDTHHVGKKRRRASFYINSSYSHSLQNGAYKNWRKHAHKHCNIVCLKRPRKIRQVLHQTVK